MRRIIPVTSRAKTIHLPTNRMIRVFMKTVSIFYSIKKWRMWKENRNSESKPFLWRRNMYATYNTNTYHIWNYFTNTKSVWWWVLTFVYNLFAINCSCHHSISAFLLLNHFERGSCRLLLIATTTNFFAVS